MNKKDAIIVDIDSTLALRGDRDVYDFERAGEDAICIPVRSLLYPCHDGGMTIIICTGQEETYREVTEDWLTHWGVPYDLLLMRATADVRDDALVKRELYDEWTKDAYNVLWVLDDRKGSKGCGSIWDFSYSIAISTTLSINTYEGVSYPVRGYRRLTATRD